MIFNWGISAMRRRGGHRLAQAALVAVMLGRSGAVMPFVWADEIASAPQLAPPLTIQLVLDAVLQHNPGLRAARELAQAARHRIPQATALEDPMVGADLEGIDGGTYMDIEYMASQTWPFPGKRRLRGQVAARASDIRQAEYEMLERDLVAQAKTVYFALALVERSLDINRQNRELLEQIERVAESQYATGSRTMQDVLKTQIELAKLSNERIGLQQERTSAIARLNALMGRGPSAPIVLTTPARLGQLRLTLDELEQRLLDARPDLKAAALAVARSSAELGVARLDYLPDFTTRVEARQFRGGGGIREFDTMLAVNVPIWSWGKQHERVKEVRATLEASKAEQERAKLDALAELRDGYARLEAADRTAELYATSILPQAEQTLNVAQTGYEAERVEFMDVLDAERAWKALQLEYHRALAAFETAWAEVERAVGQPLERQTADSDQQSADGTQAHAARESTP